MFSKKEILETIDMLDSQNLDVRAITMSLSLFDCISDDPVKTASKIYEKIVRKGEKLVKTGDEIGAEMGVEIVNKRIALTPIAFIASSGGGYLQAALAMDKAATEIGIDFIGGYSALVQKGITPQEMHFLQTIPEAIAATKKVCSCVNVASTKSGINMDAVKIMGEKIKETARLTALEDSIGCAKLVVFRSVDENSRVWREQPM